MSLPVILDPEAQAELEGSEGVLKCKPLAYNQI